MLGSNPPPKLNENGDIDEFCGDTRFLMLIHALSYRWLEASHPDREGFHLRIIAEAAQMRIEDETIAGGSLWSDVFEPLGLSKADVDFGLFWDFPSLFQSDREKGVDDRSDAQKALFKSALAKGGALNVYYGHKYTNVWIQSELPEGFGAKMEALGLARTYKESVRARTCHVHVHMHLRRYACTHRRRQLVSTATHVHACSCPLTVMCACRPWRRGGAGSSPR